jgi:poly(A) polymerase
MDFRKKAIEIVETLQREGYEALFAGGCVRDELLGREPKDYDIATNARPEMILRLFRRTLPIGKAFGVIGVITDEHTYEVATFRNDHGYEDGRRPDRVVFSTAEEDALRRDFTINGLFQDPLTGEIFDYVEGRADLERQVVRAIGDPSERFQEDHLRMLRAVRFSTTLGFELDATTAEAIRPMAALINRVSVERIQQEVSRILLEAIHPGDALRLMLDLGLLQQFLPEVADLVGIEQPEEFHPEGDVFEHTVQMLNRMEERNRVLAWSVLLHDIGKKPTAELTTEPDGSKRWRFNQHAPIGAKMAKDILQRLKFPNREIDAIVHCVKNHMNFMNVQKMRKAKLRRFIGHPTFATELELHRLDCISSNGFLDNFVFLQEFLEELAHEPALPAPWVNGHDIMALGVPRGPTVGEWMTRAYEAQLEGRATDREDLLAWLRKKISR